MLRHIFGVCWHTRSELNFWCILARWFVAHVLWCTRVASLPLSTLICCHYVLVIQYSHFACFCHDCWAESWTLAYVSCIWEWCPCPSVFSLCLLLPWRWAESQTFACVSCFWEWCSCPASLVTMLCLPTHSRFVHLLLCYPVVSVCLLAYSAVSLAFCKSIIGLINSIAFPLFFLPAIMPFKITICVLSFPGVTIRAWACPGCLLTSYDYSTRCVTAY